MVYWFVFFFFLWNESDNENLLKQKIFLVDNQFYKFCKIYVELIINYEYKYKYIKIVVKRKKVDILCNFIFVLLDINI